MFQIGETAKMADIAIDNDGSLKDFHREIEKQVVKPVLYGREQN